MAKKYNYNRILFGLAVLLGVIAQREAIGQAKTKAQSIKTSSVGPKLGQSVTFAFSDESALRQAVYDSAARFVGMTERTNNNDASWIAMINKANGLPSRSYYCASAFYYVHTLNGVRLPVYSVGMVSSYFRDPSKIIYRRNQRGNQRSRPKPRRMDAVSLYVSHIEGIAEDGYDPEEDDRVKCIGFNTTGGKGTLGGCYINYRRTSEIKFIANWVGPYWSKLHPIGQ